MCCMTPLLVIIGACFGLQVFLLHFFGVFVGTTCVGNVQRSYFIEKCLCHILFTQLWKDMITFNTTYKLVNEPQEVFCLVISRFWILRITCPCPCIDINLPTVITWWTQSNCLVICLLWNTFTIYLVSVAEQFSSLYWLTYLETAQTSLVLSLTLTSRTCHLWILVALPPSMIFHPHPQVMQPFLVSPDTYFFYHPSMFSNSLVASCFLAKCLPVHKKQLLADLSGPLGSNSPFSMFVKHTSPCLCLLATFYIKCNWNQPVVPECIRTMRESHLVVY